MAFKDQIQELRIEAQGTIQAWVRIGPISAFTLVTDLLAGTGGDWRQTFCRLTHFRGYNKEKCLPGDLVVKMNCGCKGLIIGGLCALPGPNHALLLGERQQLAARLSGLNCLSRI